ncbi:LLM class flavin-dependent oxidoreductase [Candidatus Spongiisocius sp.]|uniref:LLM class flavin-dependent oxidoreductase n=1 Tax=Candidatus Spongiisocius sp. TaxID=3101273 RepID=UPI003B5A436D
MKFGLLLPHFGAYASRQRILTGSILAEELGFDSLWVRDHLVFEPHAELENPNIVFYEALTTLTAVGAVTERITLGTGSLIPFRHPIHTALSVGSLAQLVGDRIILGYGAGTFDHEFEAIGMPGIFRPELVESNAHILRRLFTEDRVDYSDSHYTLDAISIEPKPPGHVPFWYCGSTPASARRAVRYCDGWMPGRTTLATIEKRVEAMDSMSAEAGRKRPTVAVIPPTSIAKTHEEAFDGLNIDGLLRWANERGKWWVKPPSGVFETAEDIEGSLIAGSPDEVVEEVAKFDAVGVEHLVFDLRLRFDRWFESIELLGDQVLPRLRAQGLAG